MKVQEKPKPSQGKGSTGKAQSKPKKSLITMLKKIDGKLLDVLRKNSGLLKREEWKDLKEEKLVEDDISMIPKGLSSRRFKKPSSSTESKSSRKKSASKVGDPKHASSYVHLDISKTSSANRLGPYLAQPNYRSTFVCTVADGSVPALQKSFPKPRPSLSNSMRSLKRMQISEAAKHGPGQHSFLPPSKAEDKHAHMGHCRR